MKAGKKSGSKLSPVPPDDAPGVPTIAIPYPPGRSWRVAEDATPPRRPFTPREKEVGGWVLEGLTDDEIAGELDIGLHTVKAHVSELLWKTRTRGRTQLMAWGWRDRMAAEFGRPTSRKPVKYK